MSTQANQYNVVAGSGGTVYLDGNLQNIKTVQIQSGTFNSNSKSITGFNTFTVSSGAIATINGTFTSAATGTATVNSGSILNMNSNMTISGTNGLTNNGTVNVSDTRTLTGKYNGSSGSF